MPFGVDSPALSTDASNVQDSGSDKPFGLVKSLFGIFLGDMVYPSYRLLCRSEIVELFVRS